MTDKDTIRSDRAALIAALQEAGVVRFTGNSCRCCFHDDSARSLSSGRGAQRNGYSVGF